MPFVVETQCIASLPRPPVSDSGTAVVSPQPYDSKPLGIKISIQYAFALERI
ncbi:hypothetical protein Barb4_00455 [Bacteroidales bacterium Barb4]|nr:hypothetical protein Barb4_00455 [Bacteroidales bacterium Barb4]